MKNLKYKLLKYSDFSLCKNEYPYLEDKSSAAIKCKNEIKSWLKNFLIDIKKIGLKKIYNFKTKSFDEIDDVANNEDFLFYSYENGTEEELYVLTDNKMYHDRQDWENNHSGDMLLLNDHDGIGIGFIGDQDIFSQVDKLYVPLWSTMQLEN